MNREKLNIIRIIILFSIGTILIIAGIATSNKTYNINILISSILTILGMYSTYCGIVETSSKSRLPRMPNAWKVMVVFIIGVLSVVIAGKYYSENLRTLVDEFIKLLEHLGT